MSLRERYAMVNHVKQPRETVRQVLMEDSAGRIRLSRAAIEKIYAQAAQEGVPSWQYVDRLMGVSQ